MLEKWGKTASSNYPPRSSNKFFSYSCRQTFAPCRLYFLLRAVEATRKYSKNSGPCRIHSHRVLFFPSSIPYIFLIKKSSLSNRKSCKNNRLSLNLLFPLSLPNHSQYLKTGHFRWWRRAGKKREGRGVFRDVCDIAPLEMVNPLFLFPSHTFPLLNWYVRLWGWERRWKEDAFPFFFLFFLVKVREGKRINYNLPTEKTSSAWTGQNPGNADNGHFRDCFMPSGSKMALIIWWILDLGWVSWYLLF